MPNNNRRQDMERWLEQVPERSPRVDDRYPQPSWLTTAGQQDRRNEGNHLVDMREIGRHIERNAARLFEAYQREAGQLEADARLVSDIKWQLHRTKKESVILGDEDPELQVKYALLDDELFHRCRTQTLTAFRDR
jgi:hypothetical protein